MSEPRFPLAGHADADARSAVDGAVPVMLSERRPGAICDIGFWPDTRQAVERSVCEILSIESLPRIGRAIASPGRVVLGLAPGRIQLVASQPGVAADLEARIPPGEGTVTDLSHARGGVRIAGQHAADVLQKGVAFDLHESAFPALSVAQSGIHHMSVTILRLDGETFDIFVFRGFAVSFWEWLTDAAGEYGWRSAAPVS